MLIDPSTSGEGGYTQIRSRGGLASVCWRKPMGQWTWVAAWQPVPGRSIMSWQGGEGSDVLACPEGPAPVSLMRLPLTGDVVVRMCVVVRTYACVGVDSVGMTFAVESSAIVSILRPQQPYAPVGNIHRRLHLYPPDLGEFLGFLFFVFSVHLGSPLADVLFFVFFCSHHICIPPAFTSGNLSTPPPPKSWRFVQPVWVPRKKNPNNFWE